MIIKANNIKKQIKIQFMKNDFRDLCVSNSNSFKEMILSILGNKTPKENVIFFFPKMTSFIRDGTP